MITHRYGHMVHEYYVRRVRSMMGERAARFAQVQTKADAERYVLDVRAKVRQCFPALPERTDLNAQITGRLDFGNFRVEKIKRLSMKVDRGSWSALISTYLERSTKKYLAFWGFVFIQKMAKFTLLTNFSPRSGA